MRYILFVVCLVLSGCLIVIDEECDRDSIDYSHTEYDCYWSSERVEVCNGYYCWNERREVQVCDEYHICYERRNW